MSLQIDVRGGTGPASALFINDQTPKPVPGPGECLVRVRAFGINRADTLQRQGLYPGISHLTKTLGLEFSGVISTIRDHEGDQAQQDGLHHWKVGDEVFGLVYGGGYAEYVLVNTQMLIAKPESLSLEECGGLCEVRTLDPLQLGPRLTMSPAGITDLVHCFASSSPCRSGHAGNHTIYTVACRLVSCLHRRHPTFSG